MITKNLVAVLKKIILGLVVLTAMTSLSEAQTLIGFWNFNNGSSSTTGPSGDIADLTPYLAPTVGSGSLTFSGDRVRVVPGYTENLPNPDPAGTGQGLAISILKGNSGGSGNPPSNEGSALTFSLNTTGYENLVMSFAGVMQTQSFTNINIAYSIAGGSFTSFANITDLPSATPASVRTFDFSAISGLDNASEIAIQLTFTGATSAGTNSVRFDNFQFNATAVPEPSTTVMLFAGAAALFFVLRRKRKVNA